MSAVALVLRSRILMATSAVRLSRVDRLVAAGRTREARRVLEAVKADTLRQLARLNRA